MNWPLALGAGAAAALAAFLFGHRDQVEKKLDAVIPSRKKRGGSSPLVSFTVVKVPWKKTRDGRVVTRDEVLESPGELALKATAVAGRADVIPLTAFALATLMASEAGNGAPLARAAIGHAALTMAKVKKIDVKKLLMPDGKFGGQQGRYASTARPPTLLDVEIAEGVLGGKIANPAPGAVQWDAPKTQDILLARGIPGYRMSAADVAVQRQKEGKEAVHLPGVDPGYLRLWRPVGKSIA